MRGKPTYKIEFVEGLAREPASGRRELEPTEIVVALCRPSEPAVSEQRSVLMGLLSDEERQRLTRFHFERDRVLFLVAHALLRITLSRYANIDPRAWQFRTGSYGRPEIADPRSRLRFSLSHTRELAACAIVLDRDIGLDVEHISRDVPLDVAESSFSSRERSDILGASATVRAKLFLEYWTLKEAYIKARGVGMSLPLDQFSFCKDPGGVWQIVLEQPLCDDPERWQFWSWQVSRNHQVALAIGHAGDP